jgi:hypothetical protein
MSDGPSELELATLNDLWNEIKRRTVSAVIMLKVSDTEKEVQGFYHGCPFTCMGMLDYHKRAISYDIDSNEVSDFDEPPIDDEEE